MKGLTATLDLETGMVYVYVKEPGTEVERTEEVNRQMLLDYDSSGELAGIELFTGRTISSNCQAEDLAPSTMDTLRR